MGECLEEQAGREGKGGLWGFHWGVVVIGQVGFQTPPHLKALIVGSSNDTVYDDWVYPGGSLRPYMFDTFSPMMTANNFAPPDPEVVGDTLAALWPDLLEKKQAGRLAWAAPPLASAV